MAKRHDCLNTVIKLYRFFTFSLPDFDFDVGKAGIEEKQKVESRKQKWEGRQAEGGVAWHFLALFGTIWHDLAPRFRARPGSGFNAKAQRHSAAWPQPLSSVERRKSRARPSPRPHTH
jgi:hypothetical protein